MAKKITELPAAASLGANDLLVKDTGSATQKIKASDLAASLGGGLGLMSSNPTTLYDGNGAKVDNGTLTISDTYSNYKWLLFVFKTNAEYCSELVPYWIFTQTSYALIKAAFVGTYNSTPQQYQYTANCYIKRTGSTTFAVTSNYSDANLTLGVTAVYGFK